MRPLFYRVPKVVEPIDYTGVENKACGGCFAIGLALLDYFSPSETPEWVWLRNTINALLGSYGLGCLLVLIGVGCWMWAAKEFRDRRKKPEDTDEAKEADAAGKGKKAEADAPLPWATYRVPFDPPPNKKDGATPPETHSKGRWK